MADPAKVLIVDDSRIFRSALEEALEGQGDIVVVGSVWNGVKALEFIRTTPPDVVALDVQMDGMGGLETLEEIQRFNAARPEAPAVGVVMVSAFTKAGADVTIQALEAGAFDFITKPSSPCAEASLQALRQQLVVKVRQFMAHRVTGAREALRRGALAPSHTDELAPPAVRSKPVVLRPVKAILIAVSTGGPEALPTLLPDLCARVEAPIFLVQHITAGFTESLATRLDQRCSHTVVEARDGEVVRPKTVYVAPSGKHLLLRATSTGQVLSALNEQPPENGCRPSADVLFRSAAAVYGGEVVALVLTGMGRDGTQGLGPLRRAGAYVIAQDEATSVVWGMPGSAVASGHVDDVLPLRQIAAAVQAVISTRGAS